MRISRHRADPQPAPAVERHGHRVFQIGKLHFRGEQAGLVAVGQLERGQAILGRGHLDRLRHVRFDLGQLAGVAVVDHLGHAFAGGDGPDTLIAVRDHLAQLGELGREIDDAKRGFAPAIDVTAVDRPIVVKELQVLLVDRRAQLFQVDRVGRAGAEQGGVEHAADLGVAALVQMHAVDRQRPLGLGHQLAAGREQVDKHDMILCGGRGQGLRVERDPLVVLAAVGQRAAFEVLVGDRREQHQLRRRGAVVLGGRRLADEVFQVALEFRQPIGAGKRFVEAEGGDHDVGLFVFQPMPMILEIERAGPQRQFVGRPAEVVDDQLQLREAAVQQRFPVAEILHPLGQRVADEDDPVAVLQIERRGFGGVGQAGRQADAQAGQQQGSQRPGCRRGDSPREMECDHVTRRGGVCVGWGMVPAILNRRWRLGQAFLLPPRASGGNGTRLAGNHPILIMLCSTSSFRPVSWSRSWPRRSNRWPVCCAAW